MSSEKNRISLLLINKIFLKNLLMFKNLNKFNIIINKKIKVYYNNILTTFISKIYFQIHWLVS